MSDQTFNYFTVHGWIRYNHGNADHCDFDVNHVAKRFEWSNKGRLTKNLDDWQQLCPSCHRKYDLTDETRQKMVQSQKGNLNATRTPVIAIKNSGEQKFKSVAEASRCLSILSTSIINCLKGRTKTAGGYKWRYEP